MKKEKGPSSKPWETSKEKPAGKGKGDDLGMNELLSEAWYVVRNQ